MNANGNLSNHCSRVSGVCLSLVNMLFDLRQQLDIFPLLFN